MKFGLHGLHRGGLEPAALVALARSAERAGFESIWVGDHIALPTGEGSAVANPALQPRLECVTTIAFLAAATTDVRLGFGVIVLPQRHPVLLAKQITSIDALSSGRLIVGIGIGYIREELRALGVSLEERAPRTDEYLNVMRALWRDAESFQGRYVTFDDVIQRPQPVQKPHPPLIFGGNSPSALRRAVKVGNGWYGWNLTAAEAASTIQRLRQPAAHLREPSLGPLEISVTPSDIPTPDQARHYAEVGVDRLILTPRAATHAAFNELIAHAQEDLISFV